MIWSHKVKYYSCFKTKNVHSLQSISSNLKLCCILLGSLASYNMVCFFFKKKVTFHTEAVHSFCFCISVMKPGPSVKTATLPGEKSKWDLGVQVAAGSCR